MLPKNIVYQRAFFILDVLICFNWKSVTVVMLIKKHLVQLMYQLLVVACQIYVTIISSINNNKLLRSVLRTKTINIRSKWYLWLSSPLLSNKHLIYLGWMTELTPDGETFRKTNRLYVCYLQQIIVTDCKCHYSLSDQIGFSDNFAKPNKSIYWCNSFITGLVLAWMRQWNRKYILYLVVSNVRICTNIIKRWRFVYLHIFFSCTCKYAIS